MEYAEYKRILDKGMIDYINGGGSVFYMDKCVKEYSFEYDEKNICIENRHHLENKAIQAIMNDKPLPPGIRLLSCVWQKG